MTALLTKDLLNVSEVDTVPGFEKIITFNRHSPSVSGIIAIHSTVKGPALGGCRFYNYPSFQAGLEDVLSLARAMSHKNTIMDLPFGGGKAIIFNNNNCHRNDILETFAVLLNRLNGQYVTTDDVGTSVEDMYYLRKFTKYARGIYCNGKQIPATSYGIYQAIKATLYYYSNLNKLTGIKVIVQGLGKVGYPLCQYLYEEGCILYVSDKIDQLVSKAIQEFNAIPFNANTMHHLTADIFSPCALGGSVTEQLLSKIHVKYVIGGENNPLASNIDKILHQKGIVYIPDYLSNAGGVIDITCEGNHYSEKYVLKNVASIYDKTLEILKMANRMKKTPREICDQYVRKQLTTVSRHP